MKAAEYPMRMTLASRKARAQHAEIKLRYERNARRKSGGSGVRFVELRELFRKRGVPEVDISSKIADLGNLYDWSAGEIGQVVELCWAEQLELGIRTIRCTDKTEAEITEFYLDRKRERDRMNKRMKRAAQPAAPKGISDRAQELLGIIVRRWTTRSDLVKAAASLPSFQRRGRPIETDARLQAVRRAIRELHQAKLIDVDDKTFNDHGQSITTVRLHV
jgi:hypothetical protein